MATLKGENARGIDDAMAQYQQYQEELDRVTERQMVKLEEGRARSRAEERADVKHNLVPGTSVKG